MTSFNICVLIGRSMFLPPDSSESPGMRDHCYSWTSSSLMVSNHSLKMSSYVQSISIKSIISSRRFSEILHSHTSLFLLNQTCCFSEIMCRCMKVWKQMWSWSNFKCIPKKKNKLKINIELTEHWIEEPAEEVAKYSGITAPQKESFWVLESFPHSFCSC